MKKIILSLLLVASPLIFAKTQAKKDCAFYCKSIPSESDVMHSYGKAKYNELHSSRLSVLTWNIYKGRMDDFVQDFNLLARNRDLILLSEVETGDPVSPTLASLSQFGWDLAASFVTKNDEYTGTAIGSYAQSIKPHFYRTTDLEPFVKSPKAMTVAEYAIANQKNTLLVVSIHGINWSGDDALERQLNAILPELQKHKGPILFAGDFNTKNKSRTQTAVRILAKAGLTRVKWENPPSKKQLDDAFVRGIRVNRARFIYDYVDTGSDHPALDLEFEVLP